MLNYDPSFEPRVNQNISQWYSSFQQKWSLNVVVHFLQKSIDFFQKIFNTDNLFFLGSIKKTDHLLIDLVDPDSHFNSFHAIGRNELTSRWKSFSKIPTNYLTLSNMLIIVDKDRHFTDTFRIFSQRLRIGLFELRSFAVLSKSRLYKVSVDVLFDCSDECSLSVGTVFVVKNCDLLVHLLSFLIINLMTSLRTKNAYRVSLFFMIFFFTVWMS